ncbi:RING-H2 finger protein ATL4O [Panicum miliaceum]|uniref:RING-type E3 ubiquitin transferase n=1 Tax=Panicum miliaceum TaxID=4540 RepID=A0A3L6RTC8_PANMI|nr:RING-H2 finger protein ATL4O [Panicum miliaceum]
MWERPPPPDTRPRRRQKWHAFPMEADLGNVGPGSHIGEPGVDRGAHTQKLSRGAAPWRRPVARPAPAPPPQRRGRGGSGRRPGRRRNTLCFGATAAILTYTLVRVAVNAHTKAVAAAVVTTFLFIWFCAGCTAYLAFCRRTLHRTAVVPAGRRPKDLLSRSAGMDLLAREPSERSWARVAPADVVITYYEQPEAAGARPAVECAVCKEEVRPAQVVGRPPACLQAFHRHCIDSWLQDHATCPVCRHKRPRAAAGRADGVTVHARFFLFSSY